MPSTDKQTSTQLPNDVDGRAIQTLALIDRAQLAVGAASARVTLPSGSEVVRVSCDTDCYILFGDNTVTASSSTGHLFTAGVEFFRVVPGDTDIAAIQVSASGVMTISKMV